MAPNYWMWSESGFPERCALFFPGNRTARPFCARIGPSHQYLSKPCDLDELKQRLARAFALGDMLNDTHLREVTGRLKTVPNLLALYVSVTEAMRSSDSSLTEIGSVIAQDMSLCANVLQLVNSAVFGLSSRGASPQQAEM